MRFYGKAESVAKRILQAFERGEIPKALAQVYIHRDDDVPCRQWSAMNQLIVALHGYSDARGYRQWQRVGRHVTKGERAFGILAPLTRKVSETDDVGKTSERVAVYGFKYVPVFGLSQTEGADLPGDDPGISDWIRSLPLIDVAESWGLSVEAFSGAGARYLGMYRHGQSIAVGVKNLSTWAHELLHAADDRLGNLKERGQHWRSETVAELGGAMLLECLGYSDESDRGGCFQYVKGYAERNEIDAQTACIRMLKRTCAAVSLVLETAEELRDRQTAVA